MNFNNKCKKINELENIAGEIATILNASGYYSSPQRALAMIILGINAIYNYTNSLERTYRIVVSLIKDYFECIYHHRCESKV